MTSLAPSSQSKLVAPTPLRQRVESSLSPGTAALRARTSLYGTEDRVVLDIGSRFWKYGFSGEAAPRGVLDVTLLGVADEMGLWHPDIAREWFADEELERATEAKVQAGLRTVFLRKLMIDAKQRKVIVAENPFLPTCVKALIARVLFDNLRVPAVSFVPTQLLALLPTGTLSALVIDCGFLETTVVPIYAARPLLPFTATTPRAGLTLIRNLRQLLLRFGAYMPPLPASALAPRPRPVSVPPEVLTYEVLNDIVSRGLFVGERFDGPPIWQQEDGESKLLAMEQLYRAHSTASSATILVRHPGSSSKGVLLVEGWIRERAAEVLFEGGELDEPSLPALIVAAVERLPLDLRKLFINSILLTGGLSMLPGFQARVLAEVDALLSKPKLQPLRPSLAILNDRAPAFTRSLLPWIGGSLAGALRTGGEEVAAEKWSAAAEDGQQRRNALLPNIFLPPLP